MAPPLKSLYIYTGVTVPNLVLLSGLSPDPQKLQLSNLTNSGEQTCDYTDGKLPWGHGSV